MAKVNVYFIVDLGALAGRLVVAMTESKQVYDEGERSYGDRSASHVAEGDFLPDPRSGDCAATGTCGQPSDRAPRRQGDQSFPSPGRHDGVATAQDAQVLLSETAGGIFVTRGVVVQGMATFQAARTQAANSVGKTVAQVSQDIRSELIATKGYSEIIGALRSERWVLSTGRIGELRPLRGGTLHSPTSAFG
jgi:hypothetical protein